VKIHHSSFNLLHSLGEGGLRVALVEREDSSFIIQPSVTVTFAGTPDGRYMVQASDNLAPAVWENVSTNTAGTDGQWTFTESTAGQPIRFYRAMAP
jgi:hypothetical protein